MGAGDGTRSRQKLGLQTHRSDPDSSKSSGINAVSVVRLWSISRALKWCGFWISFV